MRMIDSDGHDEDAWRGALASSPALRQVRDAGQEVFDGYGDMLADVYDLLRQPVPRWLSMPQHTLHAHTLRDLADLAEFRELRAIANGDPDNAALAACILGRKLAKMLGKALADLMDAESAAYARQEAAGTAAGSAADLAEELGDEHPAVVEARVGSELAIADAASAIKALPDPLTAEDLLASFRREARQVARDAVTTLSNIEEARQVVGGGTSGGLDAKLALADRLATSTKFQQLVAIAGRIKRVALDCRAAVVKDVPPEVVGVTVGREIHRTLPADRALLALPATRFLFWKKVVESQLLLHEQRGEERLGGGPIVICLDGSGSMAGARELWSKGVALGYMAIAQRERRDVVVGQFGGVAQLDACVFPFRSRPDAVRQSDVLAAVERFLDAGSTDLEGALRWAAGQVERDARFGQADIVVLTDAEATLSDTFLAEWRSAQHRQCFRSYGVLIGDGAGAGHLARAIQSVVHLPDLAADGPVLQTLFGI